MIRKTQHQRKMYSESFLNREATHIEVHLITTYWLLFIPIFKSYKLLSANM